ncbi:MAG: enoyl-CoA hydratase-related protein [Bacillota bacterium]|nr:enoyl-CoA hydratase-related protein [Bacillota bacterium]
MRQFNNLIYSVTNRIATITINRPKVLNALNRELLGELSQAVNDIENDQEILAIILTGAGEKAFVAGADVLEMRGKNSLEARNLSNIGNQLFTRIENLRVPVIAAINGFALGGGCELALACDIRVASTRAKLGQPETGIGIMAGYGGTQRLPRLVGIGIAKELLFTGEMISAERAYEIGLVNRLVEPEELLNEATKLAEAIAAKSPYGVQFSKKAVNEGMNLDLERALRLESEIFGTLFSTEDHSEGMSAFLEKRKPVFTGR